MAGLLLVCASVVPLQADCPERNLQVASLTEVGGREAVVPISLDGQGNENAISFSLAFNPARLSYRDATAGAGAVGASLLVNTNQAATGQVGLALAKPFGQSFTAGSNELVRVRFQLATVSGDTSVGFANAPLAIDVVDGSGAALCVDTYPGVITITPLLPVGIVTQPADQTVQPILNVATNVTLSVTASGSAPLFYQWRVDGAAITWGTNATLTLTNATVADSGGYDVVISNSGGSVTSRLATVTVLPPWAPPVLVTQPQHQVAAAGETVVFTVAVTGTEPFTYQWRFNGQPIGNETNPALVLPGVTTARNGNYSVVVSGPGGTVTSANASLTVSTTSRTLQLAEVSVATAGEVDVPMQFTALGDENAIGFSVGFSPRLVSFVQASLGAGATGSSLLVNTNQLASGRVGVVLARPQGMRFAAGTAPAVVLRFRAGNTPRSATISIVGEPVPVEVADVWGNPRPVVTGNGVVTVLSTSPVIVAEPQSATYPIFSTAQLAVEAAGSAPLTYLWQFNGVTVPGQNQPILSLPEVRPAQAGDYRVLVSNPVGTVTSVVATLTVPRVVLAADSQGPTGNSVDVPLYLLANGDENAVGFTLSFDPARLTFREVMTNGTIPRATLNLNSGTPGALGLAWAQNFGSSFAAGTQQMAVVRFQLGASTGETPLSFADQPVVRELVDNQAAPVNVRFESGTVTALNMPPTITQQPQSRDVESGALVAFAVSAGGSTPLSYQWQRNGVDLPGATNLSYVIVNAQPSHAGAYTVRVSNPAGTAFSSNAMLTVTPPDTEGPTLSFARYGTTPLVDGLLISTSDRFAVNAIDPSGVRSVEFYVNDALLLIDDTPSDGFAAPWNLDSVAEGNYTVTFKAWDWRNNASTLTFSVVVRFVPPPPPVITSPGSGTVVADFLATVRGTAVRNTSVLLYRNGQRVGVPIPVPLNGLWEGPITLVEGANRIEASAQNQAGEGERSAPVDIELDTTMPLPPMGVQLTALDAGRLQLTWLAPADSVTGYHVYRATESFTNKVQALRLTTVPLSEVMLVDRPPADGRYFYRVSAVNLAGTESQLSAQVSAVSDTTPPVAVEVTYSALGFYDPATQRFGRGIVNVTVLMSEPLLTPPFLSLNPAGGQPILVDLRPAANNQFHGSFAITETTPSGVAMATLSARDMAGNRGTAILLGDRFLIDTSGPEVISLTVQPSQPIPNPVPAPARITFVAQLSEPPRPETLPQFSFTLSRTAPAETPVTVIAGAQPLTWTGSFTLPANAGAPAETLTLWYRGEDDLGNVGTRIVPPAQFEVYQGPLPPLAEPLGLVARSLPAGAIGLSWQGVFGAADYALYRKGPGDTDFVFLTRTALALAWTNTPAVDGSYQFAVASVRQANRQEALSPLSNPALARSDRVAPGAPSNLTVDLAANGAFVRWNPPANLAEPVTYGLYRSDRPITSVVGLVPVIERIPVSQVVDTQPTPSHPYYAVVAADEAGNLSPPSNTGYLNAELLPPNSISIVQSNAAPPVLTWTQSGTSIRGHVLFLGEDTALAQVGGLITDRTFTDTGYAGDARRYTLRTVDLNDQQSIGRNLRLPNLVFELEDEAVVKRGLMNRLTYTVSNPSANDVFNARLETRLGERTHLSSVFEVPALGTTNVAVIVGGYSDLLGASAPLTTTADIRPQIGESVAIVRTGQVQLDDGQLVVSVLGAHFLRGGSAQVQFALFNPGGAEIEVITARGANPSPDIRFTLLDANGDVLSTAVFRANTGPGIINLPNGDAVLRLAAGAEALAAPTALPIPLTAPDRVYARVEIDRVYYRSDREDRVVMNGVQSREEFAILETTYAGQVTSITPATSRGDQPVTIAGTASFRRTGEPAGFVPMLVRIASSGFERNEQVLTDANGNFTTLFQPLAAESGGVYSVWATHPDINDRGLPMTFVIERVIASPKNLTVRAPHNYAQTVPLKVATGPGTAVANLRLEYRAQDQPNGVLRPGISVGLGQVIPALGPGQEALLNFTVTGTTDAPRTGNLVVLVTSDGAGAAGWQKIQVAYQFSEANPSLRWSPAFVDTGVAPSNSVTEIVTFENVGLVAANDLHFSLEPPDGAPAPSWAFLTTPPEIAELAVGDRFEVGLTFQPPETTPEGNYEFVLRTRAENHGPVDLGVNLAVVTSGLGDALFKVVDMFTRSDGTNFLGGVTNARVRLQHELVSTIETNLVTDTEGEAWFQELPAGQYKYYVTSDHHQGSNGRLWIRAGATAQQQVALAYSLVTVEWEVVPITIQDRYEIVLYATFETDVPAPVVTIDPPGVNLPQMFAGDVYFGEFVVYNRGLIRANNFQFMMPASDDRFDYELLAGVPDHLEARQSIRVPYRIVCKRDMPGPIQPQPRPQAIPIAMDSNGGNDDDCFGYSKGVYTTYDYYCENGLWFRGSASSGYWYSYTRGCPEFVGSIWGGGGGGGSYYTPVSTGMTAELECFPCDACEEEDECDTQCCEAEVPFGGGGSGNLQCRGMSADAPGAGGNGGAGGGSGGGNSPQEFQDDPPGARFQYTFQPRYHYDAVHAEWQLGDLSKQLEFSHGSQGISTVLLNHVPYAVRNTDRTLYQYRGNRILKLDDGWRWENKGGDWERYSADGQMLETGRRNLVRTRMIRDADGRVSAINDARGRLILSFHYTGDQLTAVEDRAGRRVEYTWQNGMISSVRDRLGQLTEYGYDGNNRMTRIADPSGLVVNLTYQAGYLISALDDAGNGKFFSYAYDPNRRQWHSSVRTTTGEVHEKTFDASGKVVRRTDNGIAREQIVSDNRTDLVSSATGMLTQRDHDEWGNLVREVRPDGGVWTWEYDPVSHHPVRTVDPRGAITLMSYDAHGNLTNRIDALGTPIARTNTWVYNQLSQLVRHSDARGNSMDYQYDPDGNLIREFDPANSSYQTLFDYDAVGNRIATTNALGHATFFGYDALDRLVAETNALGHVTLYTYDDNHLVEIETGRDGDQPGRIVRYRYDERGRRTHTLRVDADGQEHLWERTTHDADGRLIATANALGQTTRYDYNDLGQRERVARPFSATETSDITYEYDDYGRLVREIDPLGVVTQYEYDDLDRQRKIIEALGTPVERSREYGYDLAGNLTSITYSDETDSLTTFYDYDLPNRRVSIRGAREYPRDFEYDANNNLVAEVNGRGYRTEHTYDAYNRRISTVEGIGHGEPGEHAGTFVYNPIGQVVTGYDGNRNHRHYHYDALGRRIAESIPLGTTDPLPTGDWWDDDALVLHRTWYNPWGQTIATSNIVGAVTATVYDAFGRTFTHTDAAGLTLTNSYNTNDQLVAVGYPVVSSAPEGSPPTSIRYGYHEFNSRLLISTTDRANLTTRYNYDQHFQRSSDLSSWGALTTYTYDPLGRQIAVTNALDEVTGSVFDQFDQLVAAIHPDHEPPDQIRIEYRAYDEFGRMTNHWGAATYDVAYAYDLAGNRISLADGNDNTTRWEYDGRNRMVRKIYADDSDYEYGYDANGNQIRKRDAMQRTTQYGFNAFSLLTLIDYPTDPDVTFGYDPAGRQDLMVDGTGTNTWSHDSAGRVLTNAQLNVEHAVSYTYDAEGNRLSMTVTPLAGGEVWQTGYTYDHARRLENITDHGVSETPFRYTWATNAVRLAALTYPSGMKTSYDYDVLGRKTLLSTRDSANVEIARFAYGHDKAGQRTYETTLTHTDRFEYDAKRQLLSAQRYDLAGNADPTWSYSYAYDAIGNRSASTHPDGAYKYGTSKLNQYTSVSNAIERIIEYDSNGNCIHDGIMTFTFTDDNQLKIASNANEGIALLYDGLGRRVLLHHDTTKETRGHVYDGQLVVASISSHSPSSYRLSRGLDLHLTLYQAGGIGGILAIGTDAGTSEMGTDTAGNVRFGANTVGITETHDQSPFGLRQVGGTMNQPFGFSSKESLMSGEMIDFGGRMYVPSKGRWLTRDPLQEWGGPNLYAFVRNDPLNQFDAYGFAPARFPSPAPSPPTPQPQGPGRTPLPGPQPMPPPTPTPPPKFPPVFGCGAIKTEELRYPIKATWIPPMFPFIMEPQYLELGALVRVTGWCEGDCCGEARLEVDAVPYIDPWHLQFFKLGFWKVRQVHIGGGPKECLQSCGKYFRRTAKIRIVSSFGMSTGKGWFGADIPLGEVSEELSFEHSCCP